MVLDAALSIGLGIGRGITPTLFPIQDFGVDIPFVILGEIIAFPCFLGSPFLVRGGPEGIGWRETESHEGEGGHVERAVVGVPVGYVRM